MHIKNLFVEIPMRMYACFFVHFYGFYFAVEFKVTNAIHTEFVFVMHSIFFFEVAGGRTPLTVGVLVYYTSKDIVVSSVCLNPTSEEPGVAEIFSRVS
jgi:hypothetical protein